MRAVSPGGPATKAQQLCVASGCRCRTASTKARASAGLDARAHWARKRLRRAVVSEHWGASGRDAGTG